MTPKPQHIYRCRIYGADNWTQLLCLGPVGHQNTVMWKVIATSTVIHQGVITEVGAEVGPFVEVKWARDPMASAKRVVSAGVVV